MPAAAVIPAPIAYIKVVAVKKLVVESQFLVVYGPLCSGHCSTELNNNTGLFCWLRGRRWLWSCGSVGFRPGPMCPNHPSSVHQMLIVLLTGRYAAIGTFTLKKLECSKQALTMGIRSPVQPRIMLHGIIKYDLGSVLLVFGTS